jgi:hypothetical protein
VNDIPKAKSKTKRTAKIAKPIKMRTTDPPPPPINP